MTRGTLIVSAAAALVIAALPSPVVAQRPAPRDSATRDSLRLYALPPLAATASRVPAAPGETGVPTAVLEHRDLLAEPTARASRALTFLPGASIEEASGAGGPTVLHLRGAAEPYTQMLFDGVPINISGGFNDIAGMLITNVDRVEVARGPLSALWGSSAMAGAVQFLTHEGEAGPTRFAVVLEGGGAATHGGQGRSEITASGGGERLRYSAGAGAAYDRGIYTVPTDLATGDASLRLDATPSERWALTAAVRYMAIQSNLPVRNAGVTRVPLDPNQRDRHRRWLGSLSAGFAASPAWHHRLTASLLRDEFVYEDTFDTLPGGYPFAVFNHNFTSDRVLLRPGIEYVGTHESFGEVARLAFSYGARWQKESETNTQAGDFGDSRAELGRANSALFTELEGRWGPRLSALVGARVEKFQGLAAALLPRASVVLAIVPERVSLRASAGRAFKAPNVDQQYLTNPSTIPNPDLKPEHSVSWEVGATVTSPGRAVSLGLGYFHQIYDGLIATVAADTGSKQTNKNVGRTRSEGMELSLEHRWSAGWRGGADVSWVRTTILDNTGLNSTAYPLGGALPATPRVTGNAFVAGDLSADFSAAARLTVVGRQIVLTERFSGQRAATAGYALVELVLQWHATGALTVYTRIGNLLDAHYETAFDRPGLSRNAALGLRLAP